MFIDFLEFEKDYAFNKKSPFQFAQKITPCSEQIEKIKSNPFLEVAILSSEQGQFIFKLGTLELYNIIKDMFPYDINEKSSPFICKSFLESIFTKLRCIYSYNGIDFLTVVSSTSDDTLLIPMVNGKPAFSYMLFVSSKNYELECLFQNEGVSNLSIRLDLFGISSDTICYVSEENNELLDLHEASKKSSIDIDDLYYFVYGKDYDEFQSRIFNKE